MVQFRGFLMISCSPKNAVGTGAASAPRPARPSRQHPMQQLEGLVKAKHSPLQSSDNGEWCCLMASRGSRRKARKDQHLSLTTFSRRELRRSSIQIASRRRPSSRAAESITLGDLTLGSPAGGTTRRLPPKTPLRSCGHTAEKWSLSTFRPGNVWRLKTG